MCAALAVENGWEPTVAAPVPPSRSGAGWEPVVSPTPPAKPRAQQPAPQAPPQAVAAKAPAPASAPVEAKNVEPAPPGPAPPSPVEPPTATGVAPPEPPPSEGSLARQYCISIADAAADARFAWQKKTLAEIERELNKRIATLEEKTAEYKKWLARRDEFSQKAQESVVRIYSRMRPDAAANQLAALDEETAAAVLLKLDARTASVIMNEMDPAKAARLTGTISGAAKVMEAKQAAKPPSPAPAPPAAKAAGESAPDSNAGPKTTADETAKGSEGKRS